MNKEITINEQKKTIERLQQECIEKTNAIIKLDEKNEKLEKRVETSGETIDKVIEALYPNADEDELFAIAFNGEWIDDLKERLAKLSIKDKECEELKKQIKIIDDETIVVEITEKQFEEYQKLKAENDYLKHKILRYEEIFKHGADMTINPVTAIEVETFLSSVKALGNNLVSEENNKLHKTLDEIRKIAELHAPRCNDSADCNFECETCRLRDLKQILQKISECEVEEK